MIGFNSARIFVGIRDGSVMIAFFRDDAQEQDVGVWKKSTARAMVR
jgi:hypothetical protein